MGMNGLWRGRLGWERALNYLLVQGTLVDLLRMVSMANTLCPQEL